MAPDPQTLRHPCISFTHSSLLWLRETLRSGLTVPCPLQKHIWKHLLQSATWGL